MTPSPFDPLSGTGLSEAGYSPSVAALLAEPRRPDLGPGSPVESLRGKLVTAAGDLSLACAAGLWLKFDFLTESHEISQGLDTQEGSFWHAIMHRREPDAFNSKYWFRRVGEHPIFAELAKDAAELRYLGMGMDWSPETFVDHCEEYRGTGSEAEMTCRKVQSREWELLFAWCWNQAQ